MHPSTDAPAVEPLPAAVYTGLGRREEVVCVVHSSPRAEVTWTKDGQPLDSTVETSQVLHCTVLCSTVLYCTVI